RGVLAVLPAAELLPANLLSAVLAGPVLVGAVLGARGRWRALLPVLLVVGGLLVIGRLLAARRPFLVRPRPLSRGPGRSAVPAPAPGAGQPPVVGLAEPAVPDRGQVRELALVGRQRVVPRPVGRVASVSRSAASRPVRERPVLSHGMPPGRDCGRCGFRDLA